jgi:hypothetical protein
MATRDELVVAMRERYASSGRDEKTRVLDRLSRTTNLDS